MAAGPRVFPSGRPGEKQRLTIALSHGAEIAGTVRCATKDQRLNHSVTNAKALDLPARDLPLPPYVLGVWLVENYRNSFAQEIAASGIDGLIAKLADKNKAAAGRS